MSYLTRVFWDNRDCFLLGVIIGMVAVLLAGCAPQRQMDWGAVADAYEQSQRKP